jgi:hypothetical protein
MDFKGRWRLSMRGRAAGEREIVTRDWADVAQNVNAMIVRLRNQKEGKTAADKAEADGESGQGQQPPDGRKMQDGNNKLHDVGGWQKLLGVGAYGPESDAASDHGQQPPQAHESEEGGQQFYSVQDWRNWRGAANNRGTISWDNSLVKYLKEKLDLECVSCEL